MLFPKLLNGILSDISVLNALNRNYPLENIIFIFMSSYNFNFVLTTEQKSIGK